MAFNGRKKNDEMPKWKQDLIGWLAIAVIFGFEAWLVFLLLDWFEPMAISFCIWGFSAWLIVFLALDWPNGGYPF